MGLNTNTCRSSVLVLIFLAPAVAMLPPAAGHAQSGGGAGSTDASRAKIERRFGEALTRNLNVSVVYEDVLGEGPGHWDADPRYPKGKVNCITWLYLLLAETYGDTPKDRARVMDRIRYFDGHVGFGFRKHYTDQWMALDPGPLVRVDLSRCSEEKTHRVVLEPQKFTASIGYHCPLYRMDQRTFDVKHVNARGITKCASFLPPGYYIAFPLASNRYLEKYGTRSGPMGQVHAVVMNVPEMGGKTTEARDIKVYHASIMRGKVVETNLKDYTSDMGALFRGYAVYRLDPAWDWRAEPGMDKEAKAVVACESKLKGSVGEIFAPGSH
jgi:hypothetical protein